MSTSTHVNSSYAGRIGGAVRDARADIDHERGRSPHTTAPSYVEASPFVIVATSGPDGLDCSPRGDPAGFVSVLDERTLLIPDRRGNNRLDTLPQPRRRPADRFAVPGPGHRRDVAGQRHGRALDRSRAARSRSRSQGKLPTTVLVVTTTSVYTQCPKALIRSHLWDPSRHRDQSELPSVGDILEQITSGEFDGEAHDAAYPERVRQTIY